MIWSLRKWFDNKWRDVEAPTNRLDNVSARDVPAGVNKEATLVFGICSLPAASKQVIVARTSPRSVPHRQERGKLWRDE
ncbi:unnamed protein product [Pleuronectes platessa]|uniref:Uncharacterized protein n=1 Tax=Pleuronectes platessa TaxID=8262 RepID=A0A9N7UZA8_PLEPL|nr:unnamed protein product [Pleuronectes platessa]